MWGANEKVCNTIVVADNIRLNDWIFTFFSSDWIHRGVTVSIHISILYQHRTNPFRLRQRPHWDFVCISLRCSALSLSLIVLLLRSLWFISCIDSVRKGIKLGWFIDFSTDKKNFELHKYKINDISHLENNIHSSISLERMRFVTKTKQPFLEHLINF